jgi:hypothetical protein
MTSGMTSNLEEYIFKYENIDIKDLNEKLEKTLTFFDSLKIEQKELEKEKVNIKNPINNSRLRIRQFK